MKFWLGRLWNQWPCQILLHQDHSFFHSIFPLFFWIRYNCFFKSKLLYFRQVSALTTKSTFTTISNWNLSHLKACHVQLIDSYVGHCYFNFIYLKLSYQWKSTIVEVIIRTQGCKSFNQSNNLFIPTLILWY